MFIYAPSDDTVEFLLDDAEVSLDVFRQSPELAKKFLLSAISREKCEDLDRGKITMINQEVEIPCSGMMRGIHM